MERIGQRDTRMALLYYAGPPEPVPVVVLEGELDVLHLEAVRALVMDVAGAGPGRPLVVDLRGAGFVSLAVLALLERLGHEHDRRVRLVVPEGGLVRRVLHRVGMAADVDLHHDLVDAVLA